MLQDFGYSEDVISNIFMIKHVQAYRYFFAYAKCVDVDREYYVMERLGNDTHHELQIFLNWK